MFTIPSANLWFGTDGKFYFWNPRTPYSMATPVTSYSTSVVAPAPARPPAARPPLLTPAPPRTLPTLARSVVAPAKAPAAPAAPAAPVMRPGAILSYTQPGGRGALAPTVSMARGERRTRDEGGERETPRRQPKRPKLPKKPVDPQEARRAALQALCAELRIPKAPDREALAQRRTRYALLPRSGPPFVAVFSRSRNRYLPCCRVGTCKNPSMNRVTTAAVERVCVRCAAAAKRKRKRKGKRKGNNADSKRAKRAKRANTHQRRTKHGRV